MAEIRSEVTADLEQKELEMIQEQTKDMDEMQIRVFCEVEDPNIMGFYGKEGVKDDSTED